MRARFVGAAVLGVTLFGLPVLAPPLSGQQPGRQRLNPIIELLEQKKPVFGLYAPRPGAVAAPGATSQGQGDGPSLATTWEQANAALAYRASDYIFHSAMEDGVVSGLPAFTDFVKAWYHAGIGQNPSRRMTPIVVKTAEIGQDSTAAANIGKQLNMGVSGVMFVKAESAEEVRRGIAAMRFESKGGTRSENVGSAPTFWNMSEEEYKRRADLWPLNPEGELINWTIIESKAGLDHVREIAAVPGIGVLWPGAGTLRGVFSTTNAAGERVVDTAAHEAAIQKVLAACKEFNIACGYPANATDVELRIRQGFTVFVSQWGEAGFQAVETGRRVSGRPATNP